MRHTIGRWRAGPTACQPPARLDSERKGLRDWDDERTAIVRSAFTSWSETGLPLLFTFVLDSAAADVHVTWTDSFNESISDKTLWAHNDAWWIVDASIQLAVHHRDGTALDLDATRAIALHEVGHLIGLDHTRDTTSIMTRASGEELSTRTGRRRTCSTPCPPVPSAHRARESVRVRPLRTGAGAQCAPWRSGG